MRAALVWLCALSTAAAAPADGAAPAGHAIYSEGRSPSGARISARIGLGGQVIEGVALACGNCHGDDGRGRAEGGLAPPDIRWSTLTQPDGHRHAHGREHGPFDERSFERALRQGIDPAGQRLDAAMPRYAMSSKDFAALLAHLKQLESRHDAGIGAQTLRIGTVLPAGGPSAAAGELVRTLLQRHFDALNAQGGIHGRRLELVVKALPPEPAAARDALARWLDEADVFALLAPLSAGLEQTLSQAAAARKLPVIGPLTLYPEDSAASNLMVFHLLPGVLEQAQVLAAHAARELDLARAPIALWHAGGELGLAQARVLEARLRAQGWREVLLLPIESRAERIAAQAALLKERGALALLLIGGGADLPAMAAALERARWQPHWLLPAALAGRGVLALAPAWRDKLLLAYPTAPGEGREAALAQVARLLPEPGAARGHGAVLVAAQGAALLLVEGLKRSGRELSRRQLVATLEAVQGFDTGLMPRLSFNADRRIGAQGAFLARLEADGGALRPLPGYRTP